MAWRKLNPHCRHWLDAPTVVWSEEQKDPVGAHFCMGRPFHPSRVRLPKLKPGELTDDDLVSPAIFFVEVTYFEGESRIRTRCLSQSAPGNQADAVSLSTPTAS